MSPSISRHISRKTLMIGVGVLSVPLGIVFFWKSGSTTPSSQDSSIETELSSVSDHAASPSVSTESSIGVSERQALENQIDQLPLTDLEKQLKAEMGNLNPTAQKVLRLVFIENHSQQLSGAEALQRKYIEELRLDPQGAWNEIQRALRMPALSEPNLGTSRSSLIVLASQLSPDQFKEKFHDLALQEMKGAGIGDPEVSVVAHSLFLEATEDLDEAISATIEGINSQTDESLRRKIASQLLDRFPSARDLFKIQLEEQGIEISGL